MELDQICQVIRDVGGIDALEADQDYYDAGLISVRAVDLLLELEERSGVSIPDDRFIAVRTARGLHALVSELRGASRA